MMLFTADPRRGMGAAQSPSSDPLVSSIASAIAQEEGFNSTGTLAARNNNPGNLRSGPGQTGTSGGFAVFPDLATGWAALDNQVQLNINRGLTLNQFFAGGNGYAGYAPSSDSNSPLQYASFVGGQASIPVDVPLNQLQSGAVSASTLPAPADTTIPTYDPTTGMPVDDSSSDTTGASAAGFSFSLTDGQGNLTPLAWGGIAAGVLGVVMLVRG